MASSPVFDKCIVLVIAYDGSSFFGWQKTSDAPTIEGALQEVLDKILQESVVLQAASRTDRGVHAEGQVVNFFTSKEIEGKVLQKALNSLLPKTIRVLAVKKASLEFHPTLDAKGKTYLYHICNSPLQLPKHRLYSWHVPSSLNLEAMRHAADYCLGEQDFSSFCNMRKQLNYSNKIRNIESIAIVTLEENRLQIAVRGNHFLYKMVRTLVGTLIYVGRNKLIPDEIPQILNHKSRTHAGITAPAHGLTLKEIFYDDWQK